MFEVRKLLIGCYDVDERMPEGGRNVPMVRVEIVKAVSVKVRPPEQIWYM